MRVFEITGKSQAQISNWIQEDKTMTQTTEQCYCVSEEPQGIRPGPNAKTRMVAERDCPCCNGDGYTYKDGAEQFDRARVIASEWWNGQAWYTLSSRQKEIAWMEAE